MVESEGFVPDRRDPLYDELLVLRCQRDDAAAFDELVGRWQERLWRHARRVVGDEEAAWDVLQEAWVAVVKGLKRLDAPELFPAWAYRIVNHKAIDWIRRRQTRRKMERQALSEAERAARHPPADDNEAIALRDALDRLGADQRAILSLKYAEGFGVDEIAQILGIPEGTVKSRLHYAREALRQVLKED